MSKTKFKLEIFENEYATEHAEILNTMEMHDVALITTGNNETLTVIRVPNGVLYYRMNQMPVFVPLTQRAITATNE